MKGCMFSLLKKLLFFLQYFNWGMLWEEACHDNLSGESATQCLAVFCDTVKITCDIASVLTRKTPKLLCNLRDFLKN